MTTETTDEAARVAYKASRKAAKAARDKAILLAETTYRSDLAAAALAYNAVLNAAMAAARPATA